MTKKMRHALALMQQARADDVTTDDGVVTCDATFYDVEVKVAYVNFRTAEALAAAGLVEFGDYDPDFQSLILTEARA